MMTKINDDEINDDEINDDKNNVCNLTTTERNKVCFTKNVCATNQL